MSELANLTSKLYTITSVAAPGRSVTGVDPTRPTSQPVHIDAAIHIWRITPQAKSDVYRLSLVDSYPFTGVDNQNNVVATLRAVENREWVIKHWVEYGGAFSIELNTGRWPASVWTLSSEHDPNANIVIGNYELFPWKTQLFRIEPVIE